MPPKNDHAIYGGRELGSVPQIGTNVDISVREVRVRYVKKYNPTLVWLRDLYLVFDP